LKLREKRKGRGQKEQGKAKVWPRKKWGGQEAASVKKETRLEGKGGSVFTEDLKGHSRPAKAEAIIYKTAGNEEREGRRPKKKVKGGRPITAHLSTERQKWGRMRKGTQRLK